MKVAWGFFFQLNTIIVGYPFHVLWYGIDSEYFWFRFYIVPINTYVKALNHNVKKLIICYFIKVY
jgi:hypothetical protein